MSSSIKKISKSCEGEKCQVADCRWFATEKVEQVQFSDVPSIGHGYTAYLCTHHFNMIMGIKGNEE